MRPDTFRLLLALSLGAAAAADPCTAADLPRAYEPATIDLRTAALVVSGQEGGTIPLALLTVPWRHQESEVSATVLIEIDGPGFVAEVLGGEEPPASVDVEIFLYALRHETEVVDQLARTVTLDWSSHDELRSTGVKLLAPLRLPPGKYSVRVLTRAGEALGLRGTQLSIPDDGDEPSLGPPLFLDPDSWLVMLLDEGVVLPPPFRLEGDVVLPRGFPPLAPGRSAEALVELRRPPTEDWSLQAQWEAAGGVELAAQLPVDVGATAGLVRATTVPPELAEGRYELRMRLQADGLEGREILSDPVFVFVDTRPAIEPVVATDQEAVSLPSGRRPEKAEREVIERYLEAVGLLASGSRQEALTALVALETAAVDAFAESAFSALERLESQAWVGWPESAWNGVLPAALLHADAAREYHRRRHSALATHSVRMAVVLASSYAGKSATAEAEREAAWVLTGLAGYFQSNGSLGRAEQLFESAVALRGDDQGALLGLACIREKQGRFEGTVAALEGLIAARPDHAEGRLRLAVNLARTGAVEKSRGLLRKLRRDETAPEWVAVLAHQEQARELADDGNAREAERILRGGLRRWPGQPTLTIQLAYLLDAGGELQEARELLATVETSGRGGPAERSRYNRWSDTAVAASRLEVAERASERLDELAATLEEHIGSQRWR